METKQHVTNSDAAMKTTSKPSGSETETSFQKGGINLDPALFNLQIKRDESGVPLPVFEQPIENINIDGFLPVIINVSPVNVNLLLGLKGDPSTHTY